MTKKTFKTNYAVAVNWCNNDFVMCNHIAEIDESVIENARFDWFEDDEDGNEQGVEVFQWFITNCRLSDVEYLETAFTGLLFTYSNLLECFVLCVDHYGTSWDYVYCETTNENAARELGERK